MTSGAVLRIASRSSCKMKRLLNIVKPLCTFTVSTLTVRGIPDCSRMHCSIQPVCGRMMQVSYPAARHARAHHHFGGPVEQDGGIRTRGFLARQAVVSLVHDAVGQRVGLLEGGAVVHDGGVGHEVVV